MKYAAFLLAFLLILPAQAAVTHGGFDKPVAEAATKVVDDNNDRKKTIRELHREREEKLEARRREILEGKKKPSSQEPDTDLDRLKAEKEALDREINELHAVIKQKMERRKQVEQSIYNLKKD